LIAQHLKFLPGAPAGTIAYQLLDHAGGDQWQTITVLFNGNGQAAAVPVPAGTYSAVLRGMEINQRGLDSVVSTGTVEVAAYSALVLVQ
jgi:pullulanase